MKNQRANKGISVLIAAAWIFALLSGCSRYENPVDVPFANDEWQSMKAEEAMEELRDAGFINIEEVKKDTSDAEKAGSISKVTVDGSNLFRKGDRFESDVPVEITYFSLKEIYVTMKIETGGDVGQPEFTVRTNLPNGVKLRLSLRNGDAYSERQIVKVKDGAAVSEPFRDGGKMLEGDYTLAVDMKMEDQSATGKHELGTKGECLAGNMVRKDEATGEQYIAMEHPYTSDYKKPEKIAEEELDERMKSALAGFGEDCEVTMEGYLYTVNVWQDGLAGTAALASAGNDGAVEEWKKIAETTAAASDNLQVLLEESGYGDRMVQIRVLNDANRDNVLLSAMWGMVTYDCVS